jgi:hypothetical protein
MSVSLRRGAIGLALASALVAGLAAASHADTLRVTTKTADGSSIVADFKLK